MTEPKFDLAAGENHSAKVILLCGRIASGKTFYAQQKKMDRHTVVLSCDDLMLKLFDGCLGERHDDILRRCSHFFFHQAQEFHALGLDVLLDFGFWAKPQREEAMAYFRQRNIPAELYYFDIPEELRLRRLEERNQKLSGSPEREYIIDEELRAFLDAKFEKPADEEISRLLRL